MTSRARTSWGDGARSRPGRAASKRERTAVGHSGALVTTQPKSETLAGGVQKKKNVSITGANVSVVLTSMYTVIVDLNADFGDSDRDNHRIKP